jgi:hypothetical protein
MSDNLYIPDHARIMFANTWRDAIQQKESRLRGLVNIQTGCTGSSSTIDIGGIVDGEDVTGQRFKEVAINESLSTQRWVYPVEYQLATHESRWDANSIAPLVAPGGKATTEHTAAYSRFVDRHLLAQMLGNATETTQGSATPTTVALPAAQKVAVNYNGTASPANCNLTVEKLVKALEILEIAEVWGKDQMEAGAKLCIAVNSKASKNLLRSVETGLAAKLMSKDFMPPTLDANGHVSSFLGIHFIRTELVTVTSSIAYLPMWVSNCVQLNFWEDMSMSIDKLPNRSNALQFLTQGRLGATRIEDEGVVQIAADQS